MPLVPLADSLVSCLRILPPARENCVSREHEDGKIFDELALVTDRMRII
jgi:hypothetical protein